MSDFRCHDLRLQTGIAQTDADEHRMVLSPWTSVPPKFCRFGEPNLPFATVLTLEVGGARSALGARHERHGQ